MVWTQRLEENPLLLPGIEPRSPGPVNAYLPEIRIKSRSNFTQEGFLQVASNLGAGNRPPGLSLDLPHVHAA
jgi:hypothetical protein